MSVWNKRWLIYTAALVLVASFVAGCTALQRPDGTTTPSPTRSTGDGTRVNDDWGMNRNGTMGTRDNVRNWGADDNRNNLGVNDDRGNIRNRDNIRDDVGARTRDNARTNDNMRLADDIADKITNMKGIDNATVMVTNRTAYVAVDLPDKQEGRLTNDLKSRISDEVKRTDNKIDKVYVSGDPDFFNRMGGYAEDIRNGRPISGLFDEITETVRRIFPTAQ